MDSDMEREVLEHLDLVPQIAYDVRGVPKTAPCSCGGIITAVRSIENGHLHAYCNKCGFEIME